MAKTIKVNISELKKKKKRMQKNLDAYTQEVNALYNNYLPQIKSKWQGDDNVAYVNNLQKHLDDLKELITTIQEYIKTLNMAIERYEKAQSEAKEIVS